MEMIQVALVILNYNYFIGVTRLLRSISQRQNGNIRIFFVVVDNYSTDRDGEQFVVNLLQSDDIYIKNNANLGYARGNNIGIQEAMRVGAQYSFVVNPDILLKSEQDIFEMVRLAEKIDDFVVGGPNIIGIKPYFNRPSLMDFIFPFISSLRSSHGKEDNRPVRCYRVSGSAMLINNVRFSELNFMDPRTFLFFEEDIIGEKALRSDYSIYYMPNIYVEHEHSKSINQIFSRKKYHFFMESAKIYLHYYRGVPNPLAALIAFNSTLYRMVINKLLCRR